MEKDVILSCHK